MDKNHTMLKSLAQNVVGRKTFTSADFNTINLSGNINGIELNELIKNQVYKTDDSTIKSAVNFGGNVTAIDVNFNKTYKGISIAEFVRNVTHFAEFNNIEVLFQNLLNVAYSVQKSLKSKFFHYF